MITTSGLTKRFGRVLAVDGVDLDVREGDRYGFLGPNGSGKTTTVRMVLGLVYATRGTVEVMGAPIPGRARDVLPEVGALVEGPRQAAPLLERVCDARRAGATVLSLGPGEGELPAMAHEILPVPDGSELDLDTVQHLVSAAAGENALPVPRGRRRFRDRLSRLADLLTAPPPSRW